MHRRMFLALLPALAFGTDAFAAEKAVPQSWADFKARFYRDGRIVDTGNGNISHTEGQGVGMLAAAAANDQLVFNSLWEFTKTNFSREDGLLSWRWQPGKGVTDPNNATDGDIYVAWALHRAGVRWNRPELLKASERIRRALLRHCVVESAAGPILLPGKDGFVTEEKQGSQVVVNPSYWIYPALSQFSSLEDGHLWAKLRTTALKITATARFGPRELPADWLAMSDPYQPWSERPARFGYEAIRIPLFLAWDRQSKHAALLACAKFMKYPGFAAWVSLTGTNSAPYKAPAGFEAVAKLVRNSTNGEPIKFEQLDKDYFSSSMGLLAEIAATELGVK